ncbi:MAG: BON domain-containing protein [Planctomycetaceae bacterium]|nr:BON domain-containing protein [Planctomycetaceae bacterium]
MTGSSTTNSVTPGSTQGGGLTGQGVQQPQFRAFGESLNQNATDFVGRGTADGFVGQRLSGQPNVGGTIGPQFGALGGNQGGTNAGRGQATGPSRAVRLRPRHRVAFSYSPLRDPSVRNSLQTHLRPLQDRITGTEASLTPDGTLVLRGTALDDEARKLAEALARLEPGIRKVENQIIVAPAPPQLRTPSESAE